MSTPSNREMLKARGGAFDDLLGGPRKNAVRTSTVLILLCLVTCLVASAQTVAVSQISGTVTDSSGAPVPGAQVTAVQTTTGASRVAVTNDMGYYVLPNLVAGPYRLEVAKGGFQTYAQTGIILQVDVNPTIDVPLRVGAVTQQVEVTANAAMVETHEAAVGQVIEQTRIEELPLNGRNPAQLISLSGAAVQQPSIGGNRTYPTDVSVSVAGGLENNTTVIADSGYYMDPTFNEGLPLIFPDALQEFKVETGALPAQYGIHPGGAVNAVTKSGTNDFHGDAFYFVRNSFFNAANHFAAIVNGEKVGDGLKRNQFGGTLGGPIKKDKLFFFVGNQETIIRQAPDTNINFIPTAAMLAGNFTQFASAACNHGTAKTLSAPFVNNMVNPALFNPVALNFLKLMPVSTDPCGKEQYAAIANSTEQQGTAKVDLNVSSKQTVFAKYFISKFVSPAPLTNVNDLLTGMASGGGNGNPGVNAFVQTITFGDTYLFSSTLINSFYGGYLRPNFNRFDPPGTPTWTTLGSNVTQLLQGSNYGFFQLQITGGVGGVGTPTRNVSNAFQVGDDVNLIRGAHQFAFGANFIDEETIGFASARNNGIFSFNGSFTGLGWSDFMLGLPSTFQQSNLQRENQRGKYVGLYAQDSWKLSPKLVLNLGLRWEPFIPNHDATGIASHFDLTAYEQGIRSKVYTNAPPGLTFPGDPGFPGNAPTFGKYDQFDPRVGLVWDPIGNGKQTIRASYGVYRDFPYMWANSLFVLNPPNGDNIVLTNPKSLTSPWGNYPGGNPFPTAFPVPQNVAFPIGGIFVNEPLHVNPMYVQQWNLSLQRQFGTNWLVSLNYIGNKTTHEWLSAETNPAVYVPGQCGASPCSTAANVNSRRILTMINPTQGQYFTSVDELYDGANAAYNGLLVTVQKRFSRGFSWNNNFTWSKCMDDAEINQDIIGIFPTYPVNRSLNWGRCASDNEEVFNSSMVAQSRDGLGSGFLRALTRDWELAPIFSYLSGAPLTITAGKDNALSGITGVLGGSGLDVERPVQVAPAVIPSPTIHEWFNPAAFVPNPPGVGAGIGRSILWGPSFWSLDMALVRSFPVVGERLKGQFRAEAFNTFNHTNLGNPATALTSGSFSQITSANDPRILEFAVRLLF